MINSQFKFEGVMKHSSNFQKTVEVLKANLILTVKAKGTSLEFI